MGRRAAIVDLVHDLPTVGQFSDEEFAERHRVVLFGYAAVFSMGFATGIFDLVSGETATLHLIVEVLLGAAPALMLRLSSMRVRLLQSSLCVSGILISCGLIIHNTGGLIESHFSFFVVIPLIALYTDWRSFGLAIVYVALGHGVVGAIDPESMYNHGSAISSPYVWGLIHAGYVLALTAVMLVHWHYTDRRRVELQGLYDDLRSTQDRLRQAEKLESIGSLAAGVAHEINTPVQFVSDNLQFLKGTAEGLTRWSELWANSADGMVDGVPRPDYFAELVSAYDDGDVEFAIEEMPLAVDQCLEGMHRVAEIVKSMKNFSHPSDEVSPRNLNELINSTLTVSRNEWKYVAEVELHLADDLAMAPVPPGSFNQAILNMIVNAAHAIAERQQTNPGPGIITVTSVNAPGAVLVSIADNGAGIPEAIRHSVFDQFFTTKEIGKGTGQGLAIAHAVVAQLGGSIDLESEIGVGTTFTLTIPTATAEELVPAA